MNDQDFHGTIKMIVIWFAAFFGAVTLNQLLIGATLIYTILQIFMICRRMWKGLP